MIVWSNNPIKSVLCRIAVIAICILALGLSASATTVVMPSDDDMVIGARAIVVGRVTSVDSAMNDARSDVFTYVRLNVTRVLKGGVATGTLVLKESGGIAGGIEGVVFGSPQFAPGERVLLYLDTWPDGSPRVYQMFLGKFSITRDLSTGRTIVSRQPGNANVDVIGHSPSGPVTESLEFSRYKRMVVERLAAKRAQSDAFQAKYFSQTALLQKPPDYERKLARGELEPKFHLLVPPARWFEPDSGQSLVFTLNPDQEPDPSTADDVRAAMHAWSSVPGCLLNIELGGTADQCVSPSTLTIVFNNCDGRSTPSPYCSGIIAIGGLYKTFQQTIVVNGTQFVRATGAFISFNPYSACSFANHCDVQEITTHEMGHALGLHHSWQPDFGGQPTPDELDATMYYQAHFDGRCASIRTDDINGITFIYPGSSGGLQISTGNLPGGTVGWPYSFSLTVTGAAAPVSWSIAANKGTLPPGLTFGPNGSLAGVPTQPGTFSFSVEAVDSSGHAAQAPLSLVVNRAPLQIPAANLATAIRDTAFSQQLSAIGGQPPYAWSVQSGAVPPGLSLGPAGIISGTPTQVGDYSFTALATDSISGTATASLQLLVVGPSAVPHISSVKYKPRGGKLTVEGTNFDPSAELMVDGAPVGVRGNTGSSIISARLTLNSGTHVVTVVNPHNLTAQLAFTL